MAPAHFQHDEIKRTEPLADRLVFRGEARIAAEKHGVAWRTDDERGPQGRIAVVQAAPREVLRRRSRHGEAAVRQLMRLPPVELDDALRSHAPGFEVRDLRDRKSTRLNSSHS